MSDPQTRSALLRRAEHAEYAGNSFEEWLELERERSSLPVIDTVPKRELDAIYGLVWEKKRRHGR